MNAFDIFLIIPLLYAAYKGFRDGVIVQLGGIVGIIIGVWLAFKYCEPLGHWLKIDQQIATEVGFIVIILGVIIAIGLISWLLGKIFDMVGLGLFNKTLGVVLSIVKMSLILSVLLMAFNAINKNTPVVSEKTLDNSLLYKPLCHVSTYIFPYVDFVKNKLITNE